MVAIFRYVQFWLKRQGAAMLKMKKKYIFFSKTLVWPPFFVDIYLYGHISFLDFSPLRSLKYTKSLSFCLHFESGIYFSSWETLFWHEIWWVHSWSRDYFENLKIMLFCFFGKLIYFITQQKILKIKW